MDVRVRDSIGSLDLTGAGRLAQNEPTSPIQRGSTKPVIRSVALTLRQPARVHNLSRFLIRVNGEGNRASNRVGAFLLLTLSTPSRRAAFLFPAS